MLYQLESGHIVWRKNEGGAYSISPSVISIFKKKAQRKWWARESGGLLLGYISNEPGDIIIEHTTCPGVGDKRSRHGFFRSNRHQVEAEKWHQLTQGYGTQLGLWHTHPEPEPRLSFTDIKDYKNVLDMGEFETPGLIYIIVGTSLIRIWFIQKNKPIIHAGDIKI